LEIVSVAITHTLLSQMCQHAILHASPTVPHILYTQRTTGCVPLWVCGLSLSTSN